MSKQTSTSAITWRAGDKPEQFLLAGDGRIPNSPLPLLIYRGAVGDDVAGFEERLRANNWLPDWHSAAGLYPAHHFHSDSHEFIAVTRGRLQGQFGGPGGRILELAQGDLVVIPAGVGHFGLRISDDLQLRGGFPAGYAIHDFRLGYPDEYAQVFEAARRVPVPANDPIEGREGILVHLWKSAKEAPRV